MYVENSCLTVKSVRMEGVGSDVNMELKRCKQCGERGPCHRGHHAQTMGVYIPIWAQRDVQQEQGPSPNNGG